MKIRYILLAYRLYIELHTLIRIDIGANFEFAPMSMLIRIEIHIHIEYSLTTLV